MSMTRSATNEASNHFVEPQLQNNVVFAEDPLSLFGAVLTKVKTIWMQRDLFFHPTLIGY